MANGRTAAECYVLGFDPTNATNDFRIVSIEFVDGKPKVEWEPKVNRWTGAEIQAVLKGAEMLDGEWHEVDKASEEDKAKYRFFNSPSRTNDFYNFHSYEKLSPTAMSFMVQYSASERSIVMNPFKYGCVVDGDNFCARAEAERQLRRFAESGQNVVVQGARRMGKSSLVRKAISDMRGESMIYIDLYYIGTMADLCGRVMAGIARMNDKMSFVRKVMNLVSHLRPTLSFSTTDGSPILSVDARAADAPGSLQTVMEMLAKVAAGGKTCIVFDEFQDILRLPDANRILAEMRGSIQLQPDVPYFFLGSVRHDMMSIFSSPKSPFFKSAAAFEVDAIRQTDFAAFIVRRFSSGHRKMSSETASRIIDFADSVSGDVQELCAALWETTETDSTITESDVPVALEHIFARERKGFEKSILRLTPTQIAVLKGLAASDAAKIYSSQFLESVRITSTGTVKKAVKRLEADELVYEWQRSWRFVDPFFREWVRRKI